MIRLIFQCRLFGDDPVAEPRCTPPHRRPIQRAPAFAPNARAPSFAPKAEYRLNEIAEAPPSRRERVGLIAQRASRTRIREPRRQVATADTLNNAASLGAANGRAAQLSQSELDALRARLSQCWSPPPGVDAWLKARHRR